MPATEVGCKTNGHFWKLAWLNSSWCGQNVVTVEDLKVKHPDLKVRLTISLWLSLSFLMVQQSFLDGLSQWENLNSSQSSESPSKERASQIHILSHLANSTLEKVPGKGQDALYRTIFNYRLLDVVTWMHLDPVMTHSPMRKLCTTVPVLTNIVSHVLKYSRHVQLLLG
jgi:hypothetical protein